MVREIENINTLLNQYKACSDKRVLPTDLTEQLEESLQLWNGFYEAFHNLKKEEVLSPREFDKFNKFKTSFETTHKFIKPLFPFTFMERLYETIQEIWVKIYNTFFAGLVITESRCVGFVPEKPMPVKSLVANFANCTSTLFLTYIR